MTTQADLARRLRTLHAQPPLVLPNAWDAGSARAIEAAGAAARNLPDREVRTACIDVSPPAVKLTRTRSRPAKCAPRTAGG